MVEKLARNRRLYAGLMDRAQKAHWSMASA
jgi:hypothetical protein